MCLFCTRLKNKLCNYLVAEIISIFRLPSMITVLPEITPDKAHFESHLYCSLFYIHVLFYTPGFTKKVTITCFRAINS